MVQIRPADSRDIQAIAAVHVASWKDAYKGILPDAYLQCGVSDDLLAHWQQAEIRAEDVVLVAEHEGVIGFIAVWCRPEPLIDNLHVDPLRRSRGVGRALMQAAAERLMEMGQSTACLWVLAENRRALRFYELLGGVSVERADTAMFGHMLPSIRIRWSDLSAIARVR